MLKAVQHSQYIKNGRTMLTYKVTGPTNEIAEYLAIESLRQNRTPDQLPKADGFPLMFLNRDLEFQNGRVPQPSYTLIKNFAGTRYVHDTTAADNAKFARISNLVEDHMAKELALRALGGGNRNTTTAPATVAPQAAPAVVEAPSIADDILNAVENGGNGTQPEAALVGEGGGDGTLAD